jgi:GNAT superfamily N-acetyltransferase
MTRSEFATTAIRFSEVESGQEIGRIYLYILTNDLHAEPYGLLEDLFVSEAYRQKGIGKKLVTAAIAEAQSRGCYKLLATSRHERTEIHAWYERLGFVDYGKEFRMNFGSLDLA